MVKKDRQYVPSYPFKLSVIQTLDKLMEQYDFHP